MEDALAREALTRWSWDRDTAVAPQDSLANAVFAVACGGETCFLRLTDPSWRSLADTEVELAFVAHLSSRGVRVALPIASLAGRMVENVRGSAAVLFRCAPGLHVEPSDPDWCEDLFREWGRTMARQHEAARAFSAPSVSWRDDWRLEPAMRDGLAAIEARDAELSRASAHLLSELERYGSALGETGMIHADLAPQNFRYDRTTGITTFDFANCCRHWFLYDFAVSCYALRRVPERDRLAAWLADGYREQRPLPGDPDLMGLLLRLRTLYVYCDRLKQFGATPGADGLATLREIRGRFLRDPL
ncbi:MAG: phosphotransferase [Rhizomicrobium sp.]